MEVVEKRESGRFKDAASKRILDKATRKRRQQRQLEALEKDNTHEDPHGHLNVLQGKNRIPAFNDTMDEKKKKKKSKTGEHFKQRFKRTFAALLEEAQQELEEGEPGYASANVPPSRFPERHFCAVCGFPSNYTCISCGARYCCVKCLSTHQDTRFICTGLASFKSKSFVKPNVNEKKVCLKWTV